MSEGDALDALALAALAELEDAGAGTLRAFAAAGTSRRHLGRLSHADGDIGPHVSGLTEERRATWRSSAVLDRAI